MKGEQIKLIAIIILKWFYLKLEKNPSEENNRFEISFIDAAA